MTVMDDQDTKHVSLMAIDQYHRWVNWTPELTDEEKAILIEQVQQGKVERCKPSPDTNILEDAMKARDRLVAGLQRIVIQAASRAAWGRQSMDFMDFVQEGNIGLLKAIEEHKPENGNHLEGLARRCVRSAIWKARTDGDRTVRLPRYLHTHLSKMQQAHQQLVFQFDREPTLAEMAQEMGVSEDKLHDLVTLKECYAESLEALLMEEGMDDKHDFVSLFTTTAVEQTKRQETLKAALHDALHTALPDYQREVLSLRYGLDEERGQAHTQMEVATLLGAFVQTVNRSEHRAEARLRKALTPIYEAAG